LIERSALDEALHALPEAQRAALTRVAARVRRFAKAQQRALTDIEVDIPGGAAGHHVEPVERAGCYAPGGRHPLPSSVLMTAVTARAAGVRRVIVASPRPAPATLAAAAVAGADAVLAVGGAQAVAALAYGAGPIEAVDVLVGPGNAWVTAAKQIVMGQVGIDMLAGPSELVVLADDSASPSIIAADLIAQAEHDPDAFPALVTTSEALVSEVERELTEQLRDLPTAAVARASLSRGAAVVCATLDEALLCCDKIAPEHLEVMTRDAPAVARRLRHYGALFIGGGAAEVLGDYGAGPNHVLPTGSTARYTGGLSVMNFLRVRTWMRVDDAAEAAGVINDAVMLARIEGLEGHARAAERRRA
jgi:phosphoribosyl-ATP pyrophosphohydrolase/phosphoribosyl-AMP cyclohydrolase/histidinol dehydrogenase